MAHYVMSDIHGEADRFHAMLAKIQLSQNDTLYILGDVIDRGPDGISLLQEIMEMPNVVMLLVNHEHMMFQYMRPDADETAIRRWNKNGNGPTKSAFLHLKAKEQNKILTYLQNLPTHLELEVEGRKFYLVHVFPGNNVHDEVWHRPKMDTQNPLPDCTVLIGHTPIPYLITDEDERIQYAMDLEERGEHLRICHALGFIDIDCGCGSEMPIQALACIRLENMVEYYC